MTSFAETQTMPAPALFTDVTDEEFIGPRTWADALAFHSDLSGHYARMGMKHARATGRMDDFMGRKWMGLFHFHDEAYKQVARNYHPAGK